MGEVPFCRGHRRRYIIPAILSLLLAPAARAGYLADPIMPVAEVKPGMTGMWKTCVSGTDITQFPMRVVGIMPNMIYPGECVILCEALDTLNKHSGPVAGMSGSPVCIGGKIIGAYAYGQTQQRDQTLFMATPIELMLKMGKLPRTVPAQGFSPKPVASPAETATAVEADEANLSPLFVSGVSPKTLAWLHDRFKSRGISVFAAGSSPGAAVSPSLA